MPDATFLLAPAKVNLGLEILHRRPDGFHALETIFYRIALADEITLRPQTSGLTMECDDPLLSTGGDNLCLRAAAAIQREAKIDAGVHVTLRKRIPTGAGLGGGSSDAAAVLRGLNELWSAGLTPDTLMRLAAGLGSDVAAFLGAPLSFGSGRGEVLEDLPSRLPYWLVCVTPPVSVSTAWAYQHFRIRVRSGHRPLRDRFLESVDDLASLTTVLTNDFEEIVLPLHPAIAEVKASLVEAGCPLVLMSGSGSSVFGLCEDRSVADAAVKRFSAPSIVSLTPPLR